MNRNIVKMLIVRHQNIISFSKNIEALFSNIALLQFVSNTLVICCLGFVIVILAPLSSDCPILLTRTYSANCDLYTGLPIATNSCDTSSSSSLAIPYVTLP
ncbi:uncharacterized protein LOC112552317 isoform X1 [Pogonomyrmex barbatus]|uniref:Uncharacterized protein LOC112552317 isoform X1 n=1 Tax=Pogonomyrmex barbatus TaxID=144034 RepID=A0A8N1S333_9HYME|nr:uncharacterized protein LOC112552317 isoform X1 [Pogonomyrmex barbatus]